MIVGVAGQAEVEEISTFIDDNGLDGFEHISDLDGQLWNRFSVTGQPTFILLDDGGSITRQVGALEPDAFEAMLAELISR